MSINETNLSATEGSVSDESGDLKREILFGIAILHNQAKKQNWNVATVEEKRINPVTKKIQLEDLTPGNSPIFGETATPSTWREDKESSMLRKP